MGKLVRFKENKAICLERDEETLEIIVCAVIDSEGIKNTQKMGRAVDLLLELRGFPEIGEYIFLSSKDSLLD